jgi:2-polyprenyl-3-methyl-5-hydroxy-6-metoxy-1,4-benzoquinol methylase
MPEKLADTACPLCAGLAHTRVWTVTADAIQRRLSLDWSASISWDAFPVSPDARFVLYECGSCGLQFFSPAMVGGVDFYQQVMATVPYDASRWEFGQVARELRAMDRVVDFGCGEGAFLQMAKPLVRQAVGVDHNPDAINRLQLAGLTGEATSCSEFARRHPEGFDVACAFQTLEHVADIAGFMDAVIGCVRPGGRIFLSVPNRRRFGQENGEPLDCPPHHVSRWDPAQWQVLAELFGLELLRVQFEEPDLSHIYMLYRQRLERHCARLMGRPAPSPVWRAYLKLMVGPARYEQRSRQGWYSRRGIYGTTMLAQLQRPYDLPSRALISGCLDDEGLTGGTAQSARGIQPE